MIENVGNLVCPAEFRVGEHHRVMVTSVAEGEDKPLKYPLMFRACELVLVNKIDLLPHLDVDLDRYLDHLDAVHPGRRAHARQREDRRGSSTRLARATGLERVARARMIEERDRCERALLRGGGRPHRRALAASSRSASGAAARLLAVGASPQDWSDARHVAVEFVHPVIVGKRALARARPRRPASCRCSPRPRTR